GEVVVHHEQDGVLAGRDPVPPQGTEVTSVLGPFAHDDLGSHFTRPSHHEPPGPGPTGAGVGHCVGPARDATTFPPCESARRRGFSSAAVAGGTMGFAPSTSEPNPCPASRHSPAQ